MSGLRGTPAWAAVRTWLAAPALLGLVPAQACELPAATLGLGLRQVGTELLEYAADGRVLVREQGDLPGAVATLGLQCDGWQADAELVSDGGSRAYAGLSSIGTPLATRSRLGVDGIRVALFRQFGDALQLGAELARQHTTREIASTPSVLGYPESYERALARLGMRWSVGDATGRWTLSIATAIAGTQSMQLRLPGRDATRLGFDTPSQWELGLGWRRALTRTLYLDVSYRYIETETQASNVATVTSGGTPVGVAYQPRMRLVDQPLTFVLGLRL